MSSITRTLPCPLVNQLSEPTLDGGADENKDDNCLFASAASALMAAHPGTRYDGDEIKDAVMGQGYTGFGYFCAALTTYLARNDLSITVETSGDLAVLAHQFIDRGVPLLAVIPSAWNTQHGAVTPTFSTHVVLLCGTGDADGWLRAMNPWGGFWHDSTDVWWASRFCYGALWALIPTSTTKTGGSPSMGVPAGWHWDGKTLTAPNGVNTGGWIAQHIMDAQPQWPAELVPLQEMYGVTGGGWSQPFGLRLDCTAQGAVTAHAGALPAPTVERVTVDTTDPKAAEALALVRQFKTVLGDL